MSIKDLFNKKVNSLSSKEISAEDYKEVESINNVNERVKSEIRFSPKIDFENPAEFANYGLAEKYYSDAIESIYKTYPYDGSFYEKQKWHNESSDLVNYFFENKFPRNNGFINFGQNYGSSSVSSENYYSSSVDEFIFFKGTYNEGNKHNPSKNREYNLKIDGNEGNTIEFYFKRDNFSGSHKQIIVDFWNNELTSSENYGRVTVELHPGIPGEEDKLYLSVLSGTVSHSFFELGENLDFIDSWHHYAISYINTGSAMKADLFVDGKQIDSKIDGNSIGRIYGGMRGHIGSLITSVSGTSAQKGWGKLSGSLDEFRFWKKRRNDKQILLNYFSEIGGGVNTDDSNTDLGIYYKFNEGIYDSNNVSEFDKIILDYSGRTTNAAWTGYTIASRNTGSGIVLSGNSKEEFKDPVVYASHPEVVSLKNKYKEIGYEYDIRNNASIYGSLPSWKLEEDQGNGKGTQNLMQVISEIFDDLHNKIRFLPTLRNIEYREQPLPFSIKLLENYGFDFADIFGSAELNELFLDRNEKQNYEEKIYKIKNIIYQNIYNNIVRIYKSKGTPKSFRNLLHCFGIGEELLKFQIYADGEEYEIKDRFRNNVIKRNTINFNNPESYEAVIWQKENPEDSNSIGYLKPSSDISSLGSTLEVEIFFPKKIKVNEPLYFPYNFFTSSLFGIHEESAGSWSSNDRVDLQVFAVREALDSSGVYFLLSSSYLGINERTNFINDVYEDKRWNISLRIKPKEYPLANNVSGTVGEDYVLEVYGSSHVQDIKENSFTITSSLTPLQASGFYSARKTIYVGAHRTDFSGSVVSIDSQDHNKQCTDIELLSLRFWNSYLSNDTIDLHSKTGNNYGAKDLEHKTAAQQLILQNNFGSASVEQNNSLSMHWNYFNPSIQNGEFSIPDAASGSSELLIRDYLSDYTQNTFTGFGKFFNDQSNIVKTRFINSTEVELPDSISPDDLVQITDEYYDLFEKEKSFIDYHFSLEKSLYNVISKEMIAWLGTVKEFNSLLGNPKNRYEESYKDLDTLRTLFFKNVESEPDYDRFVEFYKWVDNSISYMIEKLIPASLNFVPSVMNIVESHTFERNKYRHKLPTIEFPGEVKIPSLKGVPSLLYNWKTGHAPLSLQESQNCFWWLTRAERTGSLNPDREEIFNVISNGINKKYDSSFSFMSDTVTITGRKEKASLNGNVMIKKSQQDIIINEIGFGLSSSDFIEITDNIPSFSDCDDD